jgi:hypothetical protein
VALVTISRIERFALAPMYDVMLRVARALRTSAVALWPELAVTHDDRCAKSAAVTRGYQKSE